MSDTLRFLERLALTDGLRVQPRAADASADLPDGGEAAALGAVLRFGLLPERFLAWVIPGIGSTARRRLADRLVKRGWADALRARGRGLDGAPIDLLRARREGWLALRRWDSRALDGDQRLAPPWKAVTLKSHREGELKPGNHPRHGIRAAAWCLALTVHAHAISTGRVRTPRAKDGQLLVPADRWTPTGTGEVVGGLPAGVSLAWDGMSKAIYSDGTVELEIAERQIDVLVEFQNKIGETPKKLVAYDAMLTGWSQAMPQYRPYRPLAVFVYRDRQTAAAAAAMADELLTGRASFASLGDEHAYRPSREHMLFAAEPDLHAGDGRALMVPRLPPDVRDNGELKLTTVEIVPEHLRCRCGLCDGRAAAAA